MTLTQINKAGLDELALDHVFTIGASGTDHYTFQGEGLNGTVNDPTLYLTRGKTYRFENGTGSHPIRIQSTSGASGTAYNTGVTNNAGSGTVIVEVQHDAPDVLYYQCTSHANMNGVLYITGALADSGVTTAKLAADAVTQAKIADDAVGADQLASNSVVSASIVDATIVNADISNSAAITGNKLADDTIDAVKLNSNSVTTAKIADGNVTTAKIADSAITTAKVQNESITLDKLLHGDGTSDGKFLRANNGGDPTFETVSSVGGATGVDFNDNVKARFGTGNDLELYHDGTHSYIKNDTGHVHLSGNGTNKVYIQGKYGEESIIATGDGSVELYHDNTKRVETTGGGLLIGAGGSTPIITNTSSPVYTNAGLELHRGGNGYCNVRFASNYGVTMSLAGISNSSTTEFSFIQDNGGNAYIRNESTSPMLFQIGSSGLSSTNTMVMYNGGEVIKPRQPCFSVKNTTNGTFSWTNQSDFPCNSEHFDRGGNYNTSNYRFTAPVDGVYQFNFFTIIRGNDDNREIAFMVNNSSVKRILSSFSWQSGTSNYDYMAYSLAWYLSASDYMTVQNRSGKSITVHGNEYSSFSGFLVA